MTHLLSLMSLLSLFCVGSRAQTRKHKIHIEDVMNAMRVQVPQSVEVHIPQLGLYVRVVDNNGIEIHRSASHVLAVNVVIAEEFEFESDDEIVTLELWAHDLSLSDVASDNHLGHVVVSLRTSASDVCDCGDCFGKSEQFAVDVSIPLSDNTVINGMIYEWCDSVCSDIIYIGTQSCSSSPMKVFHTGLVPGITTDVLTPARFTGNLVVSTQNIDFAVQNLLSAFGDDNTFDPQLSNAFESAINRQFTNLEECIDERIEINNARGQLAELLRYFQNDLSNEIDIPGKYKDLVDDMRAFIGTHVYIDTVRVNPSIEYFATHLALFSATSVVYQELISSYSGFLYNLCWLYKTEGVTEYETYCDELELTRGFGHEDLTKLIFWANAARDALIYGVSCERNDWDVLFQTSYTIPIIEFRYALDRLFRGAIITVQTDNIGSYYRSDDAGATWYLIGESSNWNEATNLHIANPTELTRIRFVCIDLGGSGGFIGTAMDYDHYEQTGLANLTTDDDDHWSIVNVDPSKLVYNTKGDDFDERIADDAYWIWDDGKYNQIPFTFKFADLPYLIDGYNAQVTMQCNGKGTYYRTRDNDINLWSSIGSQNAGETATTITIENPNSETILQFECKNEGDIGGFIATVYYNGVVYGTTNPINGGKFSIVTIADSDLVYSPNQNMGIWENTGRADRQITGDSFWIWYKWQMTMTFEYSFASHTTRRLSSVIERMQKMENVNSI